MQSHQIRSQTGNGMPRSAQMEADVPDGMFPLHRLSNVCCSTGACSGVDYWPMAYAQDAWLQLDAGVDAAVPVHLVAFSRMGVGAILNADIPLEQGACGLLMTPAHGAGLSRRRVRCCWHRPHPQDSERQCAGLRFDSNEQS